MVSTLLFKSTELLTVQLIVEAQPLFTFFECVLVSGAWGRRFYASRMHTARHNQSTTVWNCLPSKTSRSTHTWPCYTLCDTLCRIYIREKLNAWISCPLPKLWNSCMVHGSLLQSFNLHTNVMGLYPLPCNKTPLIGLIGSIFLKYEERLYCVVWE